MTTTKFSPRDLPPTIEGLFTLCGGGEGGVSVSLTNDGVYLGAAVLDWVSEKERRGTDWESELRTPIGQPLLNLSFAGADLKASGPLAGTFNTVKVRPDGFLEADGHFIGLKPKEVPCLLKFRFPREWVNSIAEFSKDESEAVIVSKPGGRSIVIRAESQPGGAVRRACAEVSWRRFLGLIKTTATICHSYDKRKKTVISAGNLGIHWADNDEAGG